MHGGTVFRRILVAMDSSEAARSAFVFVTEWARSFDAKVWFIQLAEESQQRHCGVVTDVKQGGRRMANTFSVSGATQRARTRQLVSTIAEAAATYRADVLVVGFDHHRMTQGHLSHSLREQLYEETSIPVLVAPRLATRRAPAAPVAPAAPAAPAPLPVIALGPVSTVRLPDATRTLARV
jgi:nucleotide-binding universal stress UspA family protein